MLLPKVKLTTWNRWEYVNHDRHVGFGALCITVLHITAIVLSAITYPNSEIAMEMHKTESCRALCIACVECDSALAFSQNQFGVKVAQEH